MEKIGLVRTRDGRSFLVPFILITSLFFLWGVAHSILDVLNKHFQDTMEITRTRSALIQAVVYGGYFVMALPAGRIIRRFGYRTGVLTGLVLYGIGALLFIPGGRIQSFEFFLLALFVIGCGLTCLETASNPYVTVLGEPEGSERRINLAQSFNGLGWICGPLIGGFFLFAGSGDVTTPYAVLGTVILPIVGNQKGELKQVRPGIVAVRQGFYLKKNWTLQLTAGQFTNHRLGGRGDIKWRNDNGRWELGAQAGLTVYSIFVDREWTLTRKPKLDAKLYGRVYIPRWNTELTGEAARFVYGDYGVKGSAVRHFGECTVGLYALYTEGHVNGGFNFAIPLPGRKYNRWKGMRLKPADYFTYEYGMVAWGEYVDQNLGVSYTTATGENRTRGFYQPEYIRYFLMKDCQRFED